MTEVVTDHSVMHLESFYSKCCCNMHKEDGRIMHLRRKSVPRESGCEVVVGPKPML